MVFDGIVGRVSSASSFENAKDLGGEMPVAVNSPDRERGGVGGESVDEEVSDLGESLLVCDGILLELPV